MESRRKWSPDEDALLMEGYRIQAQSSTVNWHEVAKRVPGRDNKDCRKRYHNELDGNVKKGTWTKSEDERLKSYVREYGTQWAVIARQMETRSADQCSKRWNHSLKPELERRPWTEQEDQLLMRSLLPHGHRWREIQCTHFPSRSANDVKNQ
ncbi:hypothetical protein K458DRAFT_316036 [Lentithecium fluviatile CBS 122367]|uniref:Homeodomain-like protein n=1 Tax=Lentithecium fluviatile CBS 122367 TaxID=1168545 RepID=A0A6G1IL88_9PLEO|nr:hypothetical protein K458DRAFT_316036 [Lentithecium fluviatile CBS 122367]